MKKALAVALVLALGAMGLMLLGVGHAAPPPTGVLLSCFGKSADPIGAHNRNYLRSSPQAALSQWTDGTATPGEPEPDNFWDNGCVSRHGSAATDVDTTPGGVDVTITLEANDNATEGFTGQLTGYLLPTSAGCDTSKTKFSAEFAAGLPGAQTSDPITLDAACSWKLVLRSFGVGEFDGYVMLAPVQSSST